MNKWKIAYASYKEDKEVMKILEPPKGFYEADPFLFEGWLLYELYDYNKGVIAARAFPDGKPRVILERDHHLSFPCTWREGDDIYMMPETGAGDIVIFKAKNFPDDWEEVDRIPGCFGDSIYYNGHIITTEGDHQLRIFRNGTLAYAEDRMNSRCAGHIFENDGKLYRPTQLCEKIYGEGILIKEIDLGTFEERVVRQIPKWDPEATGFHTYNVENGIAVTDLRYAA